MNDKFYDLARGILIAATASCAAFLDCTFSYLVALLLGFTFNIIAGFRADEVKLKLHRIWPPLFGLEKFNGNKLKDSLMELFLITSVTYFLKGLIDLLNYEEQSAYVVQWLFALAIYVYFRNGLRNLNYVYPNVKFIRMLYAVVAFKFRELFGDKVADIVEKEESNDKK